LSREARESLILLPSNPYKESLEALSYFVVARVS